MSRAGQSPRLWEVWHARFDFSEGHGYKYRPVIVVGIQEDGTLVVMVTGSENKLSLPHDYAIRDWKQAGLEKPSIARIDRIAEIPAGYLGSARRIGKLSGRDRDRVKTLLSLATREPGWLED